MYQNQSPQGMSATVMVGPAIRISGPVCNIKQQAADTAASNMLVHLQQLHGMNQNNPMNFMGGPRPMPVLPPPAFPPTNPGLMSPSTTITASPTSPVFPSTSPSKEGNSGLIPQSSTNRQTATEKPKSPTNQPSTTNPFIPHQVLIKSRTPQKDKQANARLSADMTDVAENINHDASNQLKGLLGLSSNQAVPSNSQPTQPVSNNSQSREDSLKLLNLIKNPTSSSNTTPSTVATDLAQVLSRTQAPTQTAPKPQEDVVKKPILLAPSFFGPKKK
jgi:hypothetical protein